MALKPAQVDAVLERMGLTAIPAPTLEGLSTLYDAWCRRVPFDNVRKLIALRSGAGGPLPGDRPAEFFDAWLSHGAGGTCWAGNGALCALLQALGFDAHRGVATMMVAPDLPPNHGTVVVSLPEGDFLVDASILHVEPLAVVNGRETVVTHPAWGVTGRWLDGRYVVRWQGLMRPDALDCRVDHWPVDEARFRTQHEDTRAWSPFNFELTFTLVRGEERIGIAGGQAVKIAPDGTRTTEALKDRPAYLIEELGISEALARQIPADVPMSPPPGSRTATAGASSR